MIRGMVRGAKRPTAGKLSARRAGGSDSRLEPGVGASSFPLNKMAGEAQRKSRRVMRQMAAARGGLTRSAIVLEPSEIVFTPNDDFVAEWNKDPQKALDQIPAHLRLHVELSMESRAYQKMHEERGS